MLAKSVIIGKGSGIDENRPQRRPKYDNNYSDNYEGRDQTYGEPSNSWNDVKKAAAMYVLIVVLILTMI